MDDSLSQIPVWGVWKGFQALVMIWAETSVDYLRYLLVLNL